MNIIEINNFSKSKGNWIINKKRVKKKKVLHQRQELKENSYILKKQDL